MSADATEGTSLADLEGALLEELERCPATRNHAGRARRAKTQLESSSRVRRRQHHEHRSSAWLLRDHRRPARFCRDLASRVSAVTSGRRWRTWRAAVLAGSNRTVGWFDPIRVDRIMNVVGPCVAGNGAGARPRGPLCNGASSSSSRRGRHQRSPSTSRCTPGRSAIQRRLSGGHTSAGTRDRSGHADAVGRRHCRRDRRPRHLAQS